MPLSREEAIDLMFARFRTAWNAQAAAIVGYVPDVQYQGINAFAKPNTARYFARVSQRTVLESQSTLSTQCGLPGQKRFTTDGLLFVQIFGPTTDKKASLLAPRLARIARNAYRSNVPGDSILYRKARIQDGLEPEAEFVRFNVVTEYQYDELT